MISTLQSSRASENGAANRRPSFGADDSPPQPLADAMKETIKVAVSKYPAVAVASGFVLGGLLGWLLSRSK
jgi:hypothetical protein